LPATLTRLVEMRFFQHLRRFFKTVSEDLLFAVQPFVIRRLFRRIVTFQVVHQFAVQPRVVKTRNNVALHPDEIHHRDGDNSVLFRFQRA